jgi:hypothetical protein
MRPVRLEQQPLLLITTITATGQLETTLSSLRQQHTGRISLLLPFRSLPDDEKSSVAAANHSLENNDDEQQAECDTEQNFLKKEFA